MRRLGDVSDAFVSGLMRVRGVRRQRAYDRGFVLSDHADWPALLETVTDTGASASSPRTATPSRWRGICANRVSMPASCAPRGKTKAAPTITNETLCRAVSPPSITPPRPTPRSTQWSRTSHQRRRPTPHGPSFFLIGRRLKRLVPWPIDRPVDADGHGRRANGCSANAMPWSVTAPRRRRSSSINCRPRPQRRSASRNGSKAAFCRCAISMRRAATTCDRLGATSSLGGNVLRCSRC